MAISISAYHFSPISCDAKGKTGSFRDAGIPGCASAKGALAAWRLSGRSRRIADIRDSAGSTAAFSVEDLKPAVQLAPPLSRSARKPARPNADICTDRGFPFLRRQHLRSDRSPSIDQLLGQFSCLPAASSILISLGRWRR